jgi:hypothetical protein
MKIVLTLLILISVCTVYCQNEQSPRKNKLRRFGIFQMRQIREFIRAQELRQSIQDEQMKKKEEEMKRRKIYEMHLLYVQPRSNVLRDFHTNRF